MREEIYGAEDSFKFASHCMSAYAQASVDNRDNSVETYLLNYWVKDFTLRDLIDRIASASQVDNKYFQYLFSWLMTNKISSNTEEKWAIEDFRKLALPLAKNKLHDVVLEFFTLAVEKFGKVKVRDFMEIQLMHNQNDYNNFIAWYSIKFRMESSPAQDIADPLKMPKLKLPLVEESKTKQNKYDDIELRDALGTNPS